MLQAPVDNSTLRNFIIGNIIAFVVFIFTLGKIFQSFTSGQKSNNEKLGELATSLAEIRVEIREKYLTKEADGYKEQIMVQKVEQLSREVEDLKREHRDSKRRPRGA